MREINLGRPRQNRSQDVAVITIITLRKHNSTSRARGFIYYTM